MVSCTISFVSRKTKADTRQSRSNNACDAHERDAGGATDGAAQPPDDQAKDRDHPEEGGRAQVDVGAARAVDAGALPADEAAHAGHSRQHSAGARAAMKVSVSPDFCRVRAVKYPALNAVVHSWVLSLERNGITYFVMH